MKALEIIVQPRDAAFSIGGHTQPRFGGDHATARDACDRPVIPASALRGALRLELERLLRGRDPASTACSANRAEDEKECDCAVCRLFGQSGRAAGALRLENAVLVAGDGEAAASAVDVRSRVCIGRQRGSAVDKLLGFVETTAPLGGVTPAEFRAAAWLVPVPGMDEAANLRNLSAACAALRAIGGGKARGFGWVSCTVKELKESSSSTEAAADPPRGVTLSFEARAPLYFGYCRPIGYFQPTRTNALGSTVRGAVAFALLEHGLVKGDDDSFQRLVTSASFGSARTDGDRPSATRKRCRPTGQPTSHVTDDLVVDLLRRLAANRGIALAIDPDRACPHPECSRAVKMVPEPFASGAAHPQVRVRTRTALNRQAGTSMDAKLFSHQVLEPPISAENEKTERQPLVLRSEVWGLDATASALLAKLDGRKVWLGGKRSQGMGTCLLRVEPVAPDDLERARKRIADLKDALVNGWAAIRQAAHRDPEPILADDELPVAIVLREPWLPAADAEAADLEGGPLASEKAGGLLGSFVHLAEEGRFGALEASRYGAPKSVLRGEETPRTVVDAGSVFVYKVKQETLDLHLRGWLEMGREGCGEHRGEGWGRFEIRGPESDSDPSGSKNMMNGEEVNYEDPKARAGSPIAIHKEWLVTQGDEIGELAKDNRDWKHQVRTIWEAARLENEPLVVLNLLRYQAARNSGNWRKPADVFTALSEAIEKCRMKAAKDAELAMELIRHLLAYTYRSFTFHSAKNGHDEEES